MIGCRIVHVRNLPIVSAKGPAARCVGNPMSLQASAHCGDS